MTEKEEQIERFKHSFNAVMGRYPTYFELSEVNFDEDMKQRERKFNKFESLKSNKVIGEINEKRRLDSTPSILFPDDKRYSKSTMIRKAERRADDAIGKYYNMQVNKMKNVYGKKFVE